MDYEYRGDYNNWEERITEEFNKRLAQAFEVARKKSEEILKIEEAERNKIFARKFNIEERQKRLNGLSIAIWRRKKLVQDDYEFGVQAAVSEMLKEREKMNSERRIENAASKITDEKIREIIEDAEKKLGFKTDEQVSRELDEMEKNWGLSEKSEEV